MKKVLSGLMALVILMTSLGMAAAGAEGETTIAVSKTNYVVGTSFTLEAGNTYTAEPAGIVTISGSTITAVKAGSAVISDGKGGSVEIMVHARAADDVFSNVYDDMAADKLIYSYDNRGKPMSECRRGTKLWGYMSDGGTYSDPDTKTVFCGDNTSTSSLGFIYKLEGEADNVTVNTFTYDNLDAVRDRLEIGYVTSGSEEISTKVGGTTTLDNTELNQYDIESMLQGTSRTDITMSNPITLNSLWTRFTPADSDWSIVDRDVYTTIRNIPADAKYIAVMVKPGIVNGVSLGDPSRYRYKGIEIHYKKSIAAGEITTENKAAITFNGDIGSPALTVKRNGAVIATPSINYDNTTYTAYIDGGFAAADNVEVIYGVESWKGKIPGIPAELEFDSVCFRTAKTVYVTGTSGKIDLITEKDGQVRTDALPVNYEVSPAGIITIDSSGSLRAEAAGTARITPMIPLLSDKTFDPILITVHGQAADVFSNVYDDMAADKLIYSYDNRGKPMSECRRGTKLWGYMSDRGTYSDPDTKTVFCGDNTSTSSLGFIYKLEGEADSITVNTFTYDNLDAVRNRLEIGYVTSGSEEISTKVGGTTTLDNTELNQYDIESMLQGTSRTDITISNPITLNSLWTRFTPTDSDWSIVDRDVYTTIRNIPADAKYIAVMVKPGIVNGESLGDPTRYRYKGIEIHYKKKLVGAELNADNMAALTFNAYVADPQLTIKKNGAVIYDAMIHGKKDECTYYVDAGLVPGDTIEIETPYSTEKFAAVVPDTRAQIESIIMTNGEDDIPLEAIEAGQQKANITVKVVNIKEKKIHVFAAMYDDAGRLIKCIGREISVVNGSAEGTVSIDELGEPQTIRVFCWNGSLVPYANYKAIQTKFEKDDF